MANCQSTKDCLDFSSLSEQTKLSPAVDHITGFIKRIAGNEKVDVESKDFAKKNRSTLMLIGIMASSLNGSEKMEIRSNHSRGAFILQLAYSIYEENLTNDIFRAVGIIQPPGSDKDIKKLLECIGDRPDILQKVVIQKLRDLISTI